MKKEEGQSLVEVIAALAVAILVLVPLIRVTITSIRNADFARKRTLATKYAQEGIEEARKLRDENPAAFFSGSCPSSETIGIFQRTIKCDPANGDEKRRVTVAVSWSDASGAHETELTSYLTKWR